MKEVKKSVYYCNYCKKRYLSKYFMIRHKESCTMNPDRNCRMCNNSSMKEYIHEIRDNYSYEVNGNIIKTKDLSLLELKEVLRSFKFITNSKIIWKKKFTYEDIIEKADGCPACIMAIMRQTGLISNKFLLDNPGDKFDYKQLQENWWKIKNEEDEERARSLY